jgi:hypothetical protein
VVALSPPADVASGRLPARVLELAEDPEAWVTR